MCILNIVNALKNITSYELTDFIFQNYYKQIGFAKQLLLNESSEEKRSAIVCK